MGHGLAPFVCGRSLKKRRVDQHKRMQLIPEPRWLVPPPSAHSNRPLPNEKHPCRPLETTSRSTAREPDDTAAHHMAFRSYIFWRSLVENRDNQATELCSVNHGDMAHLPKGRLRRQAFTGKTLTAVGDPETRGHGSCLKSVTGVSVDGKSGCLRVSRFVERTHDPGSCTRGGYRIGPRLGTKSFIFAR
jgi:hypothetical protein